jgi:hypothetical protein
MEKKVTKNKNKQPAEQPEFDGLEGCAIGMPKFHSLRRANDYARLKTTAPTGPEKTTLWPNTIFVEEEYLVRGTASHGKVFRVHGMVNDESLRAPNRWQLMLMYYDVELSHSLHDDDAPCDCHEHGGMGCEMESAAVAQVVTWLQKFGDQVPKKLGHVKMSAPA